MIAPGMLALIGSNMAVRLAFLLLFVFLAFDAVHRRHFVLWAWSAFFFLLLSVFLLADKTDPAHTEIWTVLIYLSLGAGLGAIWRGASHFYGRPHDASVVTAIFAGPAAAASLPLLFGASRDAAIIAGDAAAIGCFLWATVEAVLVGYRRLGLRSALAAALALGGMGLFLAFGLTSTLIAGGSPTGDGLLIGVMLADTVSMIVLYVAHLAMPLERAHQNYRGLALYDPLTGILNRNGFFERSRSGRAEDRRRGRDATLLVVDIDHFKRVNDRLGHEAGDAVLVAFARILETSFAAPGDLVGRWGGEEFVVRIRGGTPGQVLARAESFRRRVAETRIPVGSGTVTVTCSIGTAPLDDRDDTAFDVAFAAADGALYGAKASGRDRVVAAGAAPSLEALAAGA